MRAPAGEPEAGRPGPSMNKVAAHQPIPSMPTTLPPDSHTPRSSELVSRAVANTRWHARESRHPHSRNPAAGHGLRDQNRSLNKSGRRPRSHSRHRHHCTVRWRPKHRSWCSGSRCTESRRRPHLHPARQPPGLSAKPSELMQIVFSRGVPSTAATRLYRHQRRSARNIT